MAGAGVARDLAAARRIGRALREGRLRLRHLVEVLQADPRRAPLPRAGATSSWCASRCARRRRSSASPRTWCARCRSWCRSTAASSRGLIKVRIGHVALRPAHPGKRSRALPRAAARGRARARAARAGRGPAGAGYYFDDLPALPGAPLPGERALSAARHGARVLNYCRGRGGRSRGARGARRRARARPPHGPGARGQARASS